nr:hypothetical protein CFP56_16921 [Quercus suber]
MEVKHLHVHMVSTAQKVRRPRDSILARSTWGSSLDRLFLKRARAARLELAFRTLVDEPVRAGVTEIAVPKHDSRLRLDHAEAVDTRATLGHCRRDALVSGTANCMTR